MHSSIDSRRGFARAFAGVAVALALALPAYAERPAATPGVPPGQTLPPGAQGNPPTWAGGPFYRQGVVAVANPYGAQAGAQVLQEGGNAIDAAVAVAYALNVVEPQSAGIGGGGFMLIHLAKTGETFAIDSRERAPGGAKPDMFKGLGFTQASTSGFAVGVPGMVRGTALAIENWGRLSLAQVLAPAIRLADEGFAATPRFVSSPNCTSATSRARVYPETAAYFCPGGMAIPAGTIVAQRAAREHLPQDRRGGPRRVLHRRDRAGDRRGAAALRHRRPGRIDDARRPRRLRADDPQAGGGQVPRLHDQGDELAVVRWPHASADAGHDRAVPDRRRVAGLRLRHDRDAQRDGRGDARLASRIVASGWATPTSPTFRPRVSSTPSTRWCEAPASRPTRDWATPSVVPGDPRPYDTAAVAQREYVAAGESFAGPGGSTTHFVVVDKWGNMVSYTNTIESGYGAGMFAGTKQPDGSIKSYGFLLNNELTDFNFTPNVNAFPGEEAPNDLEPGKRPRSSMVPTMIFDRAGKPIVAFGSPGGATIINSVFNVTLNLLDHGMTIQQAVDAPRISATSVSGPVGIDVGNPLSPTPFPAASITGLRMLGHNVGSPLDIGSVQAVVVDAQTGKQYGAADARREGTVIGLPRALGGK